MLNHLFLETYLTALVQVTFFKNCQYSLESGYSLNVPKFYMTELVSPMLTVSFLHL